MSRRKSKKTALAKATVPVRNPVAANPLLGKSQAHGKTRKADRRADKVQLRNMPFERAASLPLSWVEAAGSSGFSVSTGHSDASLTLGHQGV